MSRLLVIAFLGKPLKELPVHESPPVMTVPLVVLAVFSVVAGWIGAGCPVPFLFKGSVGFGSFIYSGDHGHAPEFHMSVLVLSTVVALAGLAAGYLVYAKGIPDPGRMRERFRPFYSLLVRKYFMDDIYDWLVEIVQQGWSRLCDLFDRWILIRTMVNGLAGSTSWLGEKSRLLQTGQLQTGILLIGGGTVIFLFILFSGGK